MMTSTGKQVVTSAFATALTRVEDSVIDLTRRLVRCPSVTSDTAAVESALTELSVYLADAQIEVDVSRSTAGAPILRAQVASPAEGVNLLLQGHIDVVPVDEGWQRDPFGADVDDHYLYGRGACDMKAGLAGFAGVMRALRSCGGPQQGSVTLLVDTDEETGSDSGLIPYIAEHGLSQYDWAICAEPTGLQPFLGNRGLLWLEVTVRGAAAHAGIRGAGLNPVPVAAELVTDIAADPVTVTTFHAGTVPNSIAETAVFTIDRRLQPGDPVDTIIDDLRAAMARAAERHPLFEFGLDVVKRWPPCLLDKDCDLAQAAYHAAESITGHASFGFDDACNDASFLSEAGVPTVIWGPGDPALAHTSDERVLLGDITRALHGYGRTVETLTASTR
jgi:acetylornithine deacetylase/succinyl-diaminopimelate desuccinylase-like protein